MPLSERELELAMVAYDLRTALIRIMVESTDSHARFVAAQADSKAVTALTLFNDKEDES